MICRLALIGDKFVEFLAQELLLLANGKEFLERVVVVILKRSKLVKEAKGIRKLIDLTNGKTTHFMSC